MNFWTLFKSAVTAMFVAMVGVSSPMPAQAKGDTAVYAFYFDMKDWDPAIAISEESWVLANVYETLVHYQADLETGESELIPKLATSWQVSDDGLIWTFQLREGVTFHDGTPMNAAAAKISLDRTISMGQGGAYIWSGVKEIRAPSEYVLEIETEHPMPIDLIASAQYSAYIYSPKAAEAGTEWFNEGNAAGTGPYYLRRWRRGQDTVLDRNDAYWGGWEDGQFKRVIVKVVREAATQTQLLRTGDADFISTVSIDVAASSLAGSEDITVALAPSWINKQFLINTSRYPTDNVNFRRALAHAWDYEGIIEGVYAGGAQASRGIIPSTMWGHDPDLAASTFDLEKARAYLDASGIPEADRRIVIRYVAGQTDYQNAALNFQANLAKIGIEAVLEPGAWGKIWIEGRNKASASHMISMTWWPTYPTPGDWLKGLFYTEENALFNLSHYSNPAYDALVDEGLRLEGSDRAKAIEAYQAAQRILVDDAVAIFYADVSNRRVHRSDVTIPPINPAYNAIFFYEARRKAGN